MLVASLITASAVAHLLDGNASLNAIAALLDRIIAIL